MATVANLVVTSPDRSRGVHSMENQLSRQASIIVYADLYFTFYVVTYTSSVRNPSNNLTSFCLSMFGRRVRWISIHGFYRGAIKTVHHLLHTCARRTTSIGPRKKYYRERRENLPYPHSWDSSIVLDYRSSISKYFLHDRD